MHSGAPRRAPGAAFRPHFTLAILYFALFFFAISMLLVMPQLLDLANQMPPGPAQEQLAREVAAEAIRPKLPLAVGGALLLTGLGFFSGWLPGLRRH